ncbi:MAG: DNA-3-methyladenine glycosylase [Chloroflexi bacterium]|nr:DNA-3-methyladenine glycosylase [Chloroflexota bacterium]MCI0579244.1 DNA-3-methyladenine glycosylase [Chloroflexota bacterium]MCI0647101.1 DNA-3-methyladenine glycosylase [Chloroflexota bacterium]MCI0725875.1 DNA-3-methyladenine glycosylase [Chloroflexota bacterium]
MARFPQAFYARPAREVAVALLGKRLVRLLDGRRVAGIIVETEAYCDADEPDLACHGDRANQGRPTARSEIMFGPAGFAYVYFTYGMHWMFNVVTGREGKANAVLVRALEPFEGEEIIAQNRPGRRRREWTNGPARLAQALAIDKSLNGANLFAPDGVLWVEEGWTVRPEAVCVGPRVGLGQTPEPWFSMPWRFWLSGNPFVSI